MGHKTHPIGFRLGIIRDWQSRWFAGTSKSYAAQVLEDWKIRETIRKRYVDAGISLVEIERTSQDLTVNVHTARPGIVIGRGGTRVDELRKAVETAAGGKRVRLNVLEIRQPELDAFLVARSVADQLERRVMFRRATRQAVQRTMQAGALGVKVMISGRLGGAEIARREKVMEGRVPLHTLRADIDYGLAEARTSMGRIGVKVWIYRGDILPERKTEEEPLVPLPPADAPPAAPAAAVEAPAAAAPAEAPAAPVAEPV
ncbi:MAG: 30S ribosomal protein S3 [Chloroflexi bacterium]|nr:30S ribosomal protein S3 [Chloroflexota bacterium]